MGAVDQARGLAMVVVIGAASTFCAPPAMDDPDASAEPGPLVLLTDPTTGEKDVPIDTVVKIYMSDHVDGESVRRSRFSLESGNLSYWLMAYYDPIRSRIVVWPSAQLREGAAWTFSIEEGLEGLDGAPVSPGLVTSFNTGDEVAGTPPYEDRSFEEDVSGLFTARCASCHGGSKPMAELSLEDGAAVFETAVHREADGWQGWERIYPYKPGQSYLLYKLIGDPRIQGRRMPRSFDEDQLAAPLGQSEMEIVSDWIAGGALFFDPGESAK